MHVQIVVKRRQHTLFLPSLSPNDPGTRSLSELTFVSMSFMKGGGDGRSSSKKDKQIHNKLSLQT